MPSILPVALAGFLQEQDGEVRIRGSRISLGDVVWHYQQGYTAEMLAERFPTVELGTIHHVIGFYLEHREVIDGYIRSKTAGAAEQRAAHIPGEKMVKMRERVRALHEARVKAVHAS